MTDFSGRRRCFRSLFALGMLIFAESCASYAVPGKGANFQAMGMTPTQRNLQSDPSIKNVLAKKPLANFPATVAIVRIQNDSYINRNVQTYGHGNYCVVLTRDVEKPEQLAALSKLPMLANLEPINRLELSESLTGDEQLRAAAAAVHADMVLIYTFDDNFDDRDLATALTTLTLGISPSKYLTVTSTVSAVLMDTRNGYLYGAAEVNDKRSTLANCWGENAAAEALRDQVETGAFEKLCGELKTTWGPVVKNYAIANVPKPSREQQ